MARRKKQNVLEDLFHFLLAMPWWIGPIVAVVVFSFLQFLIPSILTSTEKPDQMAKTFEAVLVPISTMLAPWAALLVLAIWAAAEIKKLLNRKRLDGQTGLDSVRALSWQEFEELTAEAFRRQGYQVELTGSSAGDGGVDIVLRRSGQLTLVQCKQWKSWSVGVKIVRELRGVMASEQADFGIVVACGSFTAEAEVFARENRITLIGGDELVQLIRSVQRASRIPTDAVGVPAAPAAARPVSASVPNVQPASTLPETTPSCPRCGTAMKLRTAKRGANAGSQFWGCPKYPACQGTRAL